MAITTGIVAYWNLDDNGSNNVSLVDSTGNGNTLTNTNGVTLGTGIIAGDAVFNGSNVLQVNNNDPFTSGDFSVCLWVNPSDISNYLSIFGTSGFAINSNSNNGGIDVNNASVGSSISTTGNLSLGTWTNIVVTNESDITSLYVNSVYQASTSQSMAIGANLNIGGVFGPAWNGQIDEVGVWGRALSQSEINVLYNNGAGTTYPFGSQPLYYNNGQYDGDWGNLFNWWKDANFSIQATALPTSLTPINLYGGVTQNRQGSDQCFCDSGTFWSANFGAGLTLQSSGVVNMQGTSILAGNTTDGVSMHDSSQIAITSTVFGDATLRDSSRNHGHILGNANVYYDGGNGQLPIGGAVDGYVDYLEWGYIPPSPSGGGGTGTISRLLKLPWFINI